MGKPSPTKAAKRDTTKIIPRNPSSSPTAAKIMSEVRSEMVPVHSCQLAYGWYAIAGGGITGTGLGLGPLWTGTISDLTSDMIFAVVGEGFHIAQRATSDYVRLAATGLTAMMGFQAFFIMAGVLRVLPFTGITLPFVAYGGSSLFANYLVVALLLRISDENSLDRRGGEIVAVKFKKP